MTIYRRGQKYLKKKHYSCNKQNSRITLHCKKKLRNSWICFDQTFLGLGLGKFFPARESLESDFPAGIRQNPFLQCTYYPFNVAHLRILLRLRLYSNFTKKQDCAFGNANTGEFVKFSTITLKNQ